MRPKTHSRVFAALLSATIIASAIPAASLTALAETAPEASQANTYVPSSNIPSYAAEAFSNAVQTYQGGTLTPLACYGEQVVAGYNYRFICRMDSNSQDDLTTLKFVTVYQDPQNNCTISNVEDLNIADYEHDHTINLPEYPVDGGMEVVTVLSQGEMPTDAESVFDSVYGNIVGVSVVPVAYLGKKTNNGTDYVYLCQRSPVVANPDTYIDILTLHENIDGTVVQNSCYTLLGTKTTYDQGYSNNGKLSYSFTGDFKDTAGYAQGTITLTADSSATYKLYWADNDSALSGYYPIGELKLSSGKSGSVTLGYHTAIPATATKVIATTGSLNNGDAYSVYTLPSYKRLSSAAGSLLYSFSTYSDVHIDKGSGWYVNAESNLKEALKYSNDKNTDFIVISGDCVTNDSGPDKEWDAYAKVLSKSDYVNPIWESDGNHDLRQDVSSGLASFVKGSGTDGSQSNKPYFYMIEPNTGDLFLFMCIEKKLNEEGMFSDEQIAWADATIGQYYNDHNVFIVQHAPIKGYGAGDRMNNPYYGGLLKQSLNSTKAFKALLEKYPNSVFLSGHTHEDFTMDYNYSDENGTSANMIHTPSLAGSTMPNSSDDGLERNGGKGFNSQAYYVEVYQNEIIFYGANMTDKKIYPLYSYIMEGSRTDTSPVLAPQQDIPLVGTTVNITSELTKVSGILSDYYKYASYDAYQALKKLYYNYKNETTADQSVITKFENAIEELSQYAGTIVSYAVKDTYYFTNNKKWSDVYAYAWNSSSDKNAEWPGKKLQKVGTNSNNEDIYVVKFNSAGEFKNIIFNAGSNAAQTVDISLSQYKNNGFYINGSSDGKLTVANYNYDSGSEPEDPEEPEEPEDPTEEHDDIAIVYYVTDEHGWSDTNTMMTYGKDGIYRVGYDAKSANKFSFNLYDKTTKKYYSVTEHADFVCELGNTATYSFIEVSSRGSSVTIDGLASGTHFDIEFNQKTKKVTVIAPQPEVPALKNNSTLSAEAVSVGDTVTLNGAAADGTAPYTYSYYYKKSSVTNWNTKLENSDKTSTSFKPGAAVPYDVKIVVKDSAGNTQEKTFTVQVAPAALANKSTVPASITLGNAITLTGAASGGTAPYTYSYYYKKSTATNWNTKLENTTSTSTSFKPGYAVPYDVKIVVKDKTGNTQTKTFTVQVQAAALANKSTVPESITLGESITIKGSATGGTAPYKYSYYYKKSTATNWNTKLENSSSTSTSFKPGSAVPYDVKIVVKDAKGASQTKTYTVSVNASGTLTNKSTAPSAITLGQSITMKGSATGGTAPYTYSYYYKKSSVSNWNTKLENTTSTSTSFKPGYAVPYDVKIVVKDKSGKTSTKTFTVNVNK